MEDIKHNSYLPHKLSDAEAADPFKVIHEFFDFAHLPDVRDILWDWLKITITGGYGKHLNPGERRDLLFFYELLEKMIEAVHVIHHEREVIKEIEDRKLKMENGEGDPWRDL